MPGDGLPGCLMELPCQLAGQALIVGLNAHAGCGGFANHQDAPGGLALAILPVRRSGGLRQPWRGLTSAHTLIQQHRKEHSRGQPEWKMHCVDPGFSGAEWFWYRDRKSTRLNSSHVRISYAVFCL